MALSRAETPRFELGRELSPPNRLAGGSFRPLRHVSVDEFTVAAKGLAGPTYPVPTEGRHGQADLLVDRIARWIRGGRAGELRLGGARRRGARVRQRARAT